MSFKNILELDMRVSTRLRLTRQKSKLFRLAAFFAHSGDSWFWLAGLGLLWLFGSPEWHRRTALLIIGIVFLAVLVLGIKFSVRRRRPEGEWGAIYRNADPHSFPSGHAARAIMLAVIVAGIGPEWLALLLILWTPLVSISRVATGVHYISDVLAGSVIGMLVGFAMLAIFPVLARIFPFLF